MRERLYFIFQITVCPELYSFGYGLYILTKQKRPFLNRYLTSICVILFSLFSILRCSNGGSDSVDPVLLWLVGPTNSCAQPSVPELSDISSPIYGSSVVKPFYFFRFTAGPMASANMEVTLQPSFSGDPGELYVGNQNVILDLNNYRDSIAAVKYDEDSGDDVVATLPTSAGNFRCLIIHATNDFSFSFNPTP
ncbi:hypothetical protein [Leptospira saintgironsiae]|nr:hypothetical protein [Leptospira saintgironsiae]